MTEGFVSAASLVELGVAGFPQSARSMRRKLQVLGIPFETVPVRGGSEQRFSVLALPRPLAKAVAQASLQSLEPASLNAAPAVPCPADLKDHQRQRMEARLALLQELDRIAESAGLNRAIAAMIDLAAAGQLPAHLQELVPVANARAGESGYRTLSRRTLLRWRAERPKGAAALAPRDVRESKIPAWSRALLQVYARPQKPSLAAALEMIGEQLPAGVAAPSYPQARRFLEKMSVVDRNRGRMGPRELKSLRGFTRRDLTDIEPLDLALMDGHSFDAEVAHPAHGHAFRPEITSIIDAKTRKLIGWSIALAESQHAVMDALRHAATSHGASAILYVDRGSGYEGQIMSAPAIGLLARIGTRHETSLPYNSQARGLIERLHQTIWVRAAKQLPTFMGADMDPEARKKVFKLTRSDLGRPYLMPWAEFLGWVERQVAAYNARPHSGLPLIADPVTGRRRAQSPDDAWNAWLASGGEPHPISEAEAVDLFRPMKEVTARRGEVMIHGNRYFARDLEHYTGERVAVAYDIHDPSRVWVRDREGRLICEAQLDGNRRDFFPKSVVEQAREQRAIGRRRRLAIHLQEVQAELAGPALEVTSTPLDPETERLAAEQLLKLAPPPANDPAPPGDPEARPTFDTDEKFAEWCLAYPDRMTEGDRSYFDEITRSPSFRLLIGLNTGADASGESASTA